MPTFNCDDIRSVVSGYSLVRECDTIANGMLRFSTPFQYPDGSFVDLFIGTESELLNAWVLTDLGQTTANLLDLHIKPWTTKKRRQVVLDICRSLDVQRSGGEFKIPLESMSEVPSAIVRLSQACIRVSDLMFTQRLAPAGAFKDDFEEFLSVAEINYEPDATVMGKYGKEVPVDFLARGRSVESLVLAASTGNAAAAHPMVNEIFRRWYDLSNARPHYQFLSVYDSRNNVFRDDDLRRLESVSSVLAFPDQGAEIQAALAA